MLLLINRNGLKFGRFAADNLVMVNWLFFKHLAFLITSTRDFRMNIGEISKPSVERAQIKRKKLNVHASEAIEETHPIDDSVELSENSRKKLLAEGKGKESHKNASYEEEPAENEDQKVARHINFSV